MQDVSCCIALKYRLPPSHHRKCQSAFASHVVICQLFKSLMDCFCSTRFALWDVLFNWGRSFTPLYTYPLWWLPNKAMSVPSETNPLHYKITCNFKDCLCFFSSRCSLLPVLWICKYELTVSVSTHLCFVVFLPPSFVMLITCAWVSKPEQWKQVCFPVWGSTLFIQPSKKSVWWGQSIISQKPLGARKT